MHEKDEEVDGKDSIMLETQPNIEVASIFCLILLLNFKKTTKKCKIGEWQHSLLSITAPLWPITTPTYFIFFILLEWIHTLQYGRVVHKPFIDYNCLIILTINDYISILEQKTKQKATIS